MRIIIICLIIAGLIKSPLAERYLTKGYQKIERYCSKLLKVEPQENPNPLHKANRPQKSSPKSYTYNNPSETNSNNSSSATFSVADYNRNYKGDYIPVSSTRY